VFDNLIESKAKRKNPVKQMVTSLIIHGLIIFLAVKATQGIAEAAAEKPVDTTMVFLKAPETPPPPPPPPQDVVVSANPPPKGFQTVVAPTDIPKDIPPVDLNQKPFDPRDFTGKGVEGGVATGIVGGTGPVDVGSVVVTSAEADDPPQMITPGPLRTPSGFEGVPGKVVISFIVDTLGRAEPGSVKVQSSTNKVFEEPAKDVILKAKLKPGRNGGKTVRVLVQLPVVFQGGGQ
jgi:TonB family protein